MVCSLSIVDTALKRIGKLDNQDKKFTELFQLLKLSTCQQYNSFNSEMDKIIRHVFSEMKREKENNLVSKMQTEHNYYPDEIKLMNDVVETLYTHGKYYLD